MNNSNVNNTGYSFSNNLLFQHKLHKKGRTVSVNVGTTLNEKSGDGALLLALRSPKLAKLDLDEDVAFPTEQIVRLIDAARDGQRIAEMKVFDGSDNGEKIFSTLSIIGRPAANPSTEKADVIASLADMRRWPVTVSYFDISKKQDTPEYILSFDLYENGVSGAMKLDYGPYVLKAQMTSLELLPTRACAK